MKKPILMIMFLVLAMALEAVADDGPYTVRVEMAETQGRVVQGEVRGHILRVDQPTLWGGTNTAPTPPETLAFAVGACVVSTARLIAMLENIDVGTISAVVEGQIDFAKALGQKTTSRAGYEFLDIRLHVDGTISRDRKKALLQKIQDRCPLCDTTAHETLFTLQMDE